MLDLGPIKKQAETWNEPDFQSIRETMGERKERKGGRCKHPRTVKSQNRRRGKPDNKVGKS